MDIEEILNFIKKRFSKDCDWINGNCFYFAIILKCRFPKLRIYYLPEEGHFIAGAMGSFYDWTGLVDLKEMPILLEDIKEEDRNWYNRLMIDCFM